MSCRALLGARWRLRLLTKQLEGLLDAPRPGAPRRITDAPNALVSAPTPKSTLHDATHRSAAPSRKRAGCASRPSAASCGLSSCSLTEARPSSCRRNRRNQKVRHIIRFTGTTGPPGGGRLLYPHFARPGGQRVVSLARYSRHRRYRHLVGHGTRPPVAVVAPARNLVGFLWAALTQADPGALAA
jgi:hypothetical protein